MQPEFDNYQFTRPQPFQVVGMGDLVTDLLVSVERLPAENGLHQQVDRLEFQPGGMGNFLIAGARLGMRMIAIGVLGPDEHSRRMMAQFQEEGVACECIRIEETFESEVVVTLVGQNGQHVFLSCHHDDPPLQHFNGAWQTTLGASDGFFSEGYTLNEPFMAEACLQAMQHARRSGKINFFDPGPKIDRTPADLRDRALALADVLLLTKDEAEGLAGAIPSAGHIEGLLKLGPRALCIKQGPSGCTIITKEETAACEGFSVTVRDTCGAGDSFDAAFVYGYLNRWPLHRIGRFANSMGAAKVQKFGAGRNVPTREEVERILINK